MKKMKTISIPIIIAMLVITLTSCGKDEITVTKGTTIEEFQNAVTMKASKALAEEYGIDISKEALREFEKQTLGREDLPQDVFDLMNHPKVLKIVLGEDGYLDSLIPALVENQLSEKIANDPDILVDEETLDLQLELLEDYLNALGIKEEARREYVRELVDDQSAHLRLELIITKKYAEEVARILEKKDPNFVEQLPFDFEELMKDK